MSNPSSPHRPELSEAELAQPELSDTVPSDMARADAEDTALLDAELSVPDLELLERVRQTRRQVSVPAAVRQRLLARVLDESARGQQNIVVPAGQLVPVQRHALTPAVWLTGGALALGLVLLANARGLLGSSADRTAVGSEPRAHGATEQGPERGEGLLQLPVFRAPAQTLAGGAFPPPGPSLFGERPFSAQSRTWQVRRWDNLSDPPAQPAVYDFAEGALCVTLGGGERVLGGWPWLAAPSEASDAPAALGGAASPGAAEQGSAATAVAPRSVALLAGKPYRLVFKAWAHEPLPAQLLIAVGHSRLPFSARGAARVPVSPEPQPFFVDFVSAQDDPSVGIAFLASSAAGAERTRVCLSDVSLMPGGAASPP
jgi:hypothetical protein